MWINLFAAVATLAAAQSAGAQPSDLDFLAGHWSLHDSAGAKVGTSTVVVQAPGAMLFEERRVGSDAAQPLWFQNSERAGGWVQLFVGAAGKVREFRQVSPAGAWPMIMAGDVVLRDGRPASFRLTMSRTSDDETRRLLKMSADSGKSWNPVFDYTYRRSATPVAEAKGW